MLLIPSMTLKDGRCPEPGVGHADGDPAAVARRLVASGATRLHLIDLDGATPGRAPNLDAVRQVVDAIGDVPVQVAGGIRSEETAAAYLEAGAQFVVVGTRALKTPHLVEDLCLEFPGHVLVGLEVRDGKLAVEGWSKLAQHSVLEAAQHFEREGVAGLVITDLARDGQLGGADVAGAAALARALSVPVLVAGGVASQADLAALQAAEADGIAGAIVGRAVREGRLGLAVPG